MSVPLGPLFANDVNETSMEFDEVTSYTAMQYIPTLSKSYILPPKLLLL